MSWSPDDEERLRRALHDEAARVVPDPDALHRIRERTAGLPWWRRSITWALATATATATATVAVGVVLSMGGDDQPDLTAVTQEPDAADETSDDLSGDEQTESDGGDDAVVNAPSGENQTRLPEDVPEADAAQIVTVPAYYLTETPSGPRLAREFRGVRERDNAAETALGVMFAGPADPDYRTPWDPDTVFSVSTGDVIEVDLALPEDGEPVPDELGELAIQQLVYTVQAALQSSDPVHILVDGEPAGELWGVDVSDALVRAPQLEVRQLVQINDPGEGVSVTNPVRISGEAALFEATYEWRIEQDATVVAEGSGQAEEGQRFAAFSFEVDLEPGDYTVVVSATDPSGGEGPGPMSDSRSFTVTSAG